MSKKQKSDINTKIIHQQTVQSPPHLINKKISFQYDLLPTFLSQIHSEYQRNNIKNSIGLVIKQISNLDDLSSKNKQYTFYLPEQKSDSKNQKAERKISINSNLELNEQKKERQKQKTIIIPTIQDSQNDKKQYILSEALGFFQDQIAYKESKNNLQQLKSEVQTLDIINEDYQQQQTAPYSKYKSKINEQDSLGMKLYIELIKNLTIVFLILSLISILIIYDNYLGTGVKKYQSIYGLSNISYMISLFSSANQIQFDIATITPHQITKIIQTQKRTVYYDIFSTVIMFIFIIYWAYKSRLIKQNYLNFNPAPFNFAIQCQIIKQEQKQTNIQQNKTMSQISDQFLSSRLFQNNSLSKEFSNKIFEWGEVAQISYIKPYSNMIHFILSFVKHLKKQVRIRLKQYNNQKKYQILNQIQKKYRYLLQSYISLKYKFQNDTHYHVDMNSWQTYQKNQIIKDYPINSAFVVFNTVSQRNHILGLFTNKLFMKQKFNFKYQGENYKINIKQCESNPWSINWQNYHFPTYIERNRFICQICLIFFIFFMITVGLFLINVNKLSVTGYKQHFHPISINDSIVMTSTLNQLSFFLSNNTQKLSYQSQIKIIKQYCKSNEDSILSYIYPQICNSMNVLTQNHSLSFAILFFFSLFLFFINLLTSKILRALVQFRRYRTISQKDNFLIIALAICSLINSAFIITFIKHQKTGPLLAKILSIFIPLKTKIILKGIQIYPQFNRRWHVAIGSQLVSNFLMSLVIMPFSYFIIYFIRYAYRANRQINKRILAQKKQLDYCLFYSLLIKTYLFCMLYSVTLPVLYILAFFSYLVQIIIRKYSLKWFLTPPLFIDQKANKIILKIFPFGLIIHLINSMYTIFHSDIFPNYRQIKETFGQKQASERYLFQIYLILIGIIVFYILYQEFINKRIYKVVLRTKQYCSTHEIKEENSEQNYNLNTSYIRENIQYNKIVKQGHILASYLMKDNPKYSMASIILEILQEDVKSIVKNIENQPKNNIKINVNC